MQAICRDPEQTPLYVASDLGLYSLPLSHKKDDRLIWVKVTKISFLFLYSIQFVYLFIIEDLT